MTRRSCITLGVLAAAVAGTWMVLMPAPSAHAGGPLGSLAKGNTGRPQLTRLQVDLFELWCDREQLMKLDLMELGKTEAGPMKATAQQVLERLRQLGPASLAVRYDNFVDLRAGCQILSGKRVPTVKDMAITGTGVITPSVEYEQLGFRATLRGEWMDETEPNLGSVAFTVESSEYLNEGVQVAGLTGENSLKLPVFNQFSSQQSIVVRNSLPVLSVCNDLSRPGNEQGQRPVLLARVVATRLIE